VHMHKESLGSELRQLWRIQVEADDAGCESHAATPAIHPSTARYPEAGHWVV
jgi:hypothetical protein